MSFLHEQVINENTPSSSSDAWSTKVESSGRKRCPCTDPIFLIVDNADPHLHSESTSIPTNPRTTRAVGYAFVDLATAPEAQRAIQELSGKEILERKVSVQLAKSPQTAAEKAEAATNGEAVSGNEGRRRNTGGRGRGRGRGRYGRGGRGGRVSLYCYSITHSATITLHYKVSNQS